MCLPWPEQQSAAAWFAVSVKTGMEDDEVLNEPYPDEGGLFGQGVW